MPSPRASITFQSTFLPIFLRYVVLQYESVGVHINAFTKSFLQNCEPCRELLKVFSHLQRRLTEKFSDPSSSSANANGTKSPEPDLAGLARYTGVSGFVFLRLICPAILGPKLFYIVRGERAYFLVAFLWRFLF